MSEKQDALALREEALAQREEAQARATDAALREFAPIFDIPLQLSVEVGRVRLQVRDLMQLVPNTIVELKKPAGEPFDVRLNGIPIGRGEVIAVDQSSGVRMVEIHKSGSMAL
jgi:flagellar motor switch protein FliN/FliY